MNDWKYWNDWSPVYRKIYLILLSIFGILVIFYCYTVLNGASNALEWRITSTLDTMSVPFKTVSVGLFDLELEADNYLINQHYMASAHQISPLSGYVYLLVFSVCLAILLTIVTYLKRFWFLIGMTMVCFIMVNFRFEQLEINGWIDNTFLIIVLGLILPACYYFHSGNDRGLVTRLATIAGLFFLIAVIIQFFSRSENPFYFLANYNYAAPVVISILFIFLVSHEIIFLILYLTSGSKAPGNKNLSHFIVLSLVYLANVGLVYLKNATHISWDIIYVNAFFLLIMSSIIGIWGFKQREILYGRIIAFNPFGGLLFLSLGIICFSTISYYAVTANDPILETFEDAIVYSHIGYGVMFFFYILANFINLLSQNLPVYRIAFKEDNMPYFSTNVAALVVIAAFYYLANQEALNRAISGYYNGLGSVYYHEKDIFLAKEYYKRASIFGQNNHRSNYGLGELAYQERDWEEAIARFKNATLKNPTEYAFINLANAQKANYLFFDALFSLREGLNVFPNSSRIRNNLGLMFKSTNILDSAIYYMESGSNSYWGNKTNTTNIIDILARNSIVLPRDSLTTIFNKTDHLPLRANLLAYGNKTGFWLRPPLEETKLDSTLNLHQFAYLFNQGFSLLKDSPGNLSSAIKSYANYESNGNFKEQLIYLGALLEYSRNNLNNCFRSIDLLQNNPQKKGYYNHVLGVICLDQAAPRLATDFFEKALGEGYSSSRVNLAIALMEAGEISRSIGLWNQLLKNDSVEVANDVLVALTAPVSIVLNSNSDALKYQFIRYRSHQIDKTTADLAVRSMENETFKLGAITAICNRLIKTGRYDEASGILKDIRSFELGGQSQNLIAKLESDLRLAIFAGNLSPLESLSSNNPIRQNWGRWKQSQKEGVLEFFQSLGMNNPFKESEVMASVKFFNLEAGDVDSAYQILLNAREINPYSVSLLKAYILQAIKIGRSNYAQDELLKLIDLVSEDEYREFRAQVEQEIALFESSFFPLVP